MNNIYIGTESQAWLGYEVLKHSILKYASADINVIPMEFNHAELWSNWDMGRDDTELMARGNNAATGSAKWFTNFTNFRWAIPEANNFSGKAIYLDFDQIVKSDIMELFNYDMGDSSVLSLTANEPSVMLMNCAKFKNFTDWPSIYEMKHNGWSIIEYINRLRSNKSFGNLPTKWNCLDGNHYQKDYTCLIHYTDMTRQPSRSFPSVTYRRHHPEMESIWFVEFYDMLDNELIDLDRLSTEYVFLDFEKVIATEFGRESIL